MLVALRTVSKVVVPLVEAQVQRMLPTQHALPLGQRAVIAPSASLRTSKTISNIPSRRLYCAKMVQPPKKQTLAQFIKEDLVQSAKSSITKLFAPPGSTSTHRVIAGLNRFGPLQLVNPFFMWKLQSSFRPYVTMGAAILSGLLLFSSTIGTTESTMRLAAVPTRYWEGDTERLFTSPFLHTNFAHLASVSGFLLAFGTAVEVAAGPIVLLSVLMSSAVAGCAAAICAPDRQSGLYLESVQLGLVPAVSGLAAFFYAGLRTTPPTYLRRNPNLVPEEKLAGRQLTRTLSARRLPLIALAILALFPLPGIETSTIGGVAGALTGGLMGVLWTRSPHLILVGGIAMAGALAYVAQSPAWSLRYQAYRFARSWEDGEFLRAREWLRLFDANSRRVTSDPQQWTRISMALAEMACGRTGAALDYAESVNTRQLITFADLSAMKEQLKQDWVEQSRQKANQARTNVPEADWSNIFSNRLDSYREYQRAFQFAPWRIMNDEAIYDLFSATFKAHPSLTAEEMQTVILHNYKGLFNFDPTYSRRILSPQLSQIPIPKDNPLQ